MLGDNYDPTTAAQKKKKGLTSSMEDTLGLDKGTETYAPPKPPPPTDVPASPFDRPFNTGLLGQGELSTNGQVNVPSVANKVSDKLKARKAGV